MKIIYFGNNIRGIKCLQALSDENFDLSAIITHYKTDNQNSENSVYQLAMRLKLPVHAPNNPNDSEFLEKLRKLKPDLMVLSGYNPFLKKEILKIPTKGTINLHGGNLPDYRGGSPINWQIINGEPSGTCSIIYVVPEIDAGDIIAQEKFNININETAGDIIKKTLVIFPKLLVKVVKEIGNGKVRAIKQDESKAKYFCKRYPKDGQINWKLMSAQEVHNLVRALNGPNLSGAFTYLNGKKIVLWKTQLITKYILGVPGRITLREKDGAIVIAKDKGLLIQEVKLDNDNKILRAVDFFKIDGWTFEQTE